MKLFKILLFLALLSAPPRPALTFISLEGGFSIWMPFEPQLREIIHKSFAGLVTEKTYSVRSGSQEFIVSYSELPRIAISVVSEKALLARAKEGFIKDTHAQELSFDKIASEGAPGRELRFQIVGKDRVIDAVGKARFYLVNRTLYVVAATESNYDGEEKAIQRFLDSFKFLPR